MYSVDLHVLQTVINIENTKMLIISCKSKARLSLTEIP